MNPSVKHPRLFWCVALVLAITGCETRLPGDPQPDKEEPPKTSPAPTPPVVTVPKPPPKRDRVRELLKYVPARSEGMILAYTRDMLKNPTVYSRAETILSALIGGVSPEMKKLHDAGLDFLKNVEGLCLISIPKLPGAPSSASEAVLVLTGEFDATKVAAALVGSGTTVEAAEPNVLLLGPAPLLSEVRGAAKRPSPLADSPALSAALAAADDSRPVYGAFYQPPPRRTGSSAEKRYHQFTLWLDPSRGLEMEGDILYADATEAATASTNMERGARSVVTGFDSMLTSMGGVPGASLSTALGFRVSGSHVIITIKLDEAQMTGMMTAISRMFPALTPKKSTPVPLPPPPMPPPPTPLPVLH